MKKFLIALPGLLALTVVVGCASQDAGAGDYQEPEAGSYKTAEEATDTGGGAAGRSRGEGEASGKGGLEGG